MKKISQIIILSIAMLISFKTTIAYYNTNDSFSNNFTTEDYSLNLNANGGYFNNDSVSIVKGKTTLPIPARTGYTFKGFSESLNGSVSYSNTINDINQINNKKLYAKWEPITYSIAYNLNGGVISNQPTTYDVEDTFTLPQPTKIGYEFIGWTGTGLSSATKKVTISKATGNRNYTANWKVVTYSISYYLNGGSISGQPTSYNVESNISLPTPSKVGYTFTGWTGTGLSSATKNVTVSKATGNRTYTANWSKNYYTVNYYVNNSLWATRSVGYNDALENLNAQSSLDIYHTFHGWTGWVNNMPNHNVNLYASITESYCRLITGHGPYGNASALLSVFQSAGWTGHIEEQTSFPGNYLVITDYTLTRAQAEVQKNYIASHTNYNNYNFPYLYWVAVECTNGYNEAWTRGLGQSSFN